MPRRLTAVCASLCVACALGRAAGSADGGDSHKCRPILSYTPGTYRLKRQENTSFSVAGKVGGGDARIERLMVLDIDVGKPDAKGLKRLTMSFRRFRLHTVGGGLAQTLDTDNPTDDVVGKVGSIMSRSIRRMTREARMVVDVEKGGKIWIVKGLDAFWDRQADKASADAERVREMKRGHGEALLESLMLIWWQFLPEEPVGAGSRWKTNVTSPVAYLGPIALSQECWVHQMDKADNGHNVLAIRFRRTGKEDKAASRPSGKPDLAFRDMNLRQTGTLWFDVEAHMPKRLVINTRGRAVDARRRAGAAKNVIQIQQRLEATIEPAPAGAATGKSPPARP